jgi:hypothetical protein
MIYVRVACATFTLLLSTSEGREYPHFVDLVDEILGNVLSEIGKEPVYNGARAGRTDSDGKDDKGGALGTSPGTPSSSRRSILMIVRRAAPPQTPRLHVSHVLWRVLM